MSLPALMNSELYVTYEGVIFDVVWHEASDCWVLSSTNTELEIFSHVKDLNEIHAVAKSAVDGAKTTLADEGKTLELNSNGVPALWKNRLAVEAKT